MTKSEYTRPTILVVDDTPAHLNLLSNLLKRQYRINAATSGAKAIELAISAPPDLVLLDIMMPDMDGYEVCRRLKANDSTRLVPVIFLTAKFEIEDEELGFAVGAVDFIHKPISPPIVLARVKTHLEIKSWHDFLQKQNAWLREGGERRLSEVNRLDEQNQQLQKQTELLTIARDSLDRTNNELTAEIAKRIDAESALKDSMRRVEEKELAKSRFLAAAGHDLRQPLAAATLFIDALKFSPHSADQNQIIQRLDYAISTFNGLLDALLNISKLDAGVIKPEYSLVNIVEIFNLLEKNFAPVAMEKQLGFKLFFPMKESVCILSDIGLVNSILMNLVSNAINCTSRGAILIAARRRGSRVLFQVWDTGIGIKADHIEHIFDEFYQINNPQRDRAKGLGLGLAIAKRALTLLGGEITCRSRVGHGSVFEFSLPMGGAPNQMTPSATAAPLDEDIKQATFIRGRHFVVLEDDALVAEAMCKALRMMGGEVELFHSAEIALSHATIEYADYYFIVDHMLEGALDGIQFLNQLREKLGKPINALLVTGDTSPAFVREAADCDWPVLHKPVNISKLIDHIKFTCP
jgi:signal transduction histidine kinase